MRLPSPSALPIRLRLAVAYAIFLTLTIAVVGQYVIMTLETTLQQEVDESLRLRGAQVQSEIDVGDDGRLDRSDAAAALSDLAPQDEFAAPGIYVLIFDATGQPLASSPNLPAGSFPPTRQLVANALNGERGYANLPVGPDRIRVLARPITANHRTVGAMLVGESLHLLDESIRQTQRLLTAAALAAALLGIAGGWVLTGRALGPAAAVARAAGRIARTGQFDQRIPVPAARDELGELVAMFNDMLERLARTLRRQQEFLADASHELRGPLMVIRGNLDLLRLDLSEVERGESIRAATAQTDRMSRLVSDLLFLAEVDAPETVRREPLALDAIVRAAAERARQVDGDRHRILVERLDPVGLSGDAERLDQVVWNLVENARRYTPPGGSISLSLRLDDARAELSVADTGVGIPVEHQPRIFERFYRVERSRSRSLGGTGLGLAIVRQTVEAHGGTVSVESAPGQGTRFVVTLPVDRPAAPLPPSALEQSALRDPAT